MILPHLPRLQPRWPPLANKPGPLLAGYFWVYAIPQNILYFVRLYYRSDADYVLQVWSVSSLNTSIPVSPSSIIPTLRQLDHDRRAQWPTAP